MSEYKNIWTLFFILKNVKIFFHIKFFIYLCSVNEKEKRYEKFI